jgi:hypothetical protein
VFGGIDSSYGDLDLETRTALASFLSDRNEYTKQLLKLNELRIKVLQNPTPDGEKQLAEYSSAIVAPLRGKLSEQTVELLKRAIDLDSLKGLLPIIFLGVTQAINVPMLLTILGIDPDMIEQLVGQAKKFVKDGLSD